MKRTEFEKLNITIPGILNTDIIKVLNGYNRIKIMKNDEEKYTLTELMEGIDNLDYLDDILELYDAQ